jgi:hypothetical protein
MRLALFLFIFVFIVLAWLNFVAAIHGADSLPFATLGTLFFAFLINLRWRKGWERKKRWKTFLGFNFFVVLLFMSLWSITADIELGRVPFSRYFSEFLIARNSPLDRLNCNSDFDCGLSNSGICVLRTSELANSLGPLYTSNKCVCSKGPTFFGCKHTGAGF